MVNTLHIYQILTKVATAKPLSPQLWRMWLDTIALGHRHTSHFDTQFYAAQLDFSRVANSVYSCVLETF
jgi:hypothetical protein